MKYTIKKDGEFVNCIVASEEFVVAEFPMTEGYTYELIPEPEPKPEPEPTAEDDMNAMLVDHEYRLTLLELGITEDV